MATAKKPAKKPATKKAPARTNAKTTVKRVSPAAKKQTSTMRSFVPATPEPFFTFRISHQTLYWLVLAVIVLLLGVWVININDKVQKIYDEIDATNAYIDSLPDPSATKKVAQ